MQDNSREEFLKTRNEIFLKIGEIKADLVKSEGVKEQKLASLYSQRDILYKNFISNNKPCEKGDMFLTESAGGRKIKGIVDDFFIRDGYVYIESYYPIIRGNKSSQKAYFSLPHKELKIVN